MFDPKCDDLARAFLEDTHTFTEARVKILAQRIQDCIEQELEDFDRDDKEQADAAYGDHIDRQIDRLRDGEL